MNEFLDHPAVQGGIALLVGAVLTTAAAWVRSLWTGTRLDTEAANRAAEDRARKLASDLMAQAILAVEERATSKDKGRKGGTTSATKRDSALELFLDSSRAAGISLPHAKSAELLDATLASISGVGATGSRVSLPPRD